MSLFYSIKEGFVGFYKARFSALLSVVSIASSLFFLGLFGLVVIQGWGLIDDLKDKIAMEVFLKDMVNDDFAESLKQRFLSFSEIDSIVYVSREQALAAFQKEMGNDILDLIGENPLPASFRLYFKTEFQQSDRIKKLQEEFESWPGVDEVVYRYDLLNILVRYVKIAILLALVVGGTLLVMSILLIANTVRHSIDRNKDAIRIMGLVGATPAFVRRPYIVEGILQGTLGAGLSILILKIIFLLISLVLPEANIQNWKLNVALLLWGVLLGGGGSVLAIRKHLKV